jgi:outer membrane protein OmpA-like peptidoglycan-associated protein
MTSDKVSHPIEEAKNAHRVEATDDLPDTTALIVDEPELATEESPTDNQAPESSSVDSRETPRATVTTGNTTKPSIVPARLILFPYKSMEIQPQFKALLNEVADELKDSPYTVARIVGIMDNRGKGSSETNRSVSIQRAEKVTRYLNDRGIAAERLRMEEDTGSQNSNLESSENHTSPRPQRVVEVTVLAPTD